MPMAQGEAKSWNANHYILAAFGGTLTATAVITIISLILSPAHVTFSVAHSSSKIFSNGTTNLWVTIAANNPSRRCGASYQSVFIELKSLKPSPSSVLQMTMHVDVPNNTFPTHYLWGPNVMPINASATYGTDELNSTGLTVIVRALVRFKIGVTPTRLYGMKVFCPGVFFLYKGSNSNAHQGVTCSG